MAQLMLIWPLQKLNGKKNANFVNIINMEPAIQDNTGGNIAYTPTNTSGMGSFLMYSTWLLLPTQNPLPSDVQLTFNVEKVAPISITLSEEEALQLEKKTYEFKKNRLIKEFNGKYIALLNGDVLKADNDFSSLASWVYENYPDTPIFMTYVSKEDRKARISTPRIKK